MDWLESHRIDLGSLHLPIGSLLLALAVVVLGFFVAARIASRIRGATKGPGWRATLAKVGGYAVRVTAIALGLQIAGIQIGSVLAAGAVVAVGVGLAMQKVAENFVSGVILMAERTIREGDVIEFDGRVARVEHMGIRATIARTLDDEEIIVPNGLLTQSAVKNLTLTEPTCRLRVKVGVSYESDLESAERVLRAAAESIAWREVSHDPIVLLLEFAPSSVDFEVSVWTSDVWAIRRGQSDLRKALWRALKEASIQIPFPQLEVHLRARDGVVREARSAESS